MRKILLIAVCFCLLALPASAAGEIINGGAEYGDFTGYSTTTGWAVSTSHPNSGTNCFAASYSGTLKQTVDMTGANTLSLSVSYWSGNYVYFRVLVDNNEVYYSSSQTELYKYRDLELDVSGYTGEHVLSFIIYAPDSAITRLDDISLSGTGVNYISWNQSTYSSGDIANISYTYPSYSASNENFIDIRSYNPASAVWELEERRFVYLESGSIQYSVPSYSSRQFRAELMTRASVLFNPTSIANATMHMTADGASLEFSKFTYGRNENITFSYANMPEGATIQFYSGTSASGATYFQQYSISGNGTAGYQLPDNGPYGELFYIRAYDKDGNELGFDYAYTENAPAGETTLHGRIRDATTEAVISGATITVGGITTTSDSSGDYSLTFPKGTWNIYVSADNYVDKTVASFTFTGTSYSYNGYLTPSPTASSTLYGSVSSSSGAAISRATVTVYNSTKTKSDVTTTGSFEIAGLVDGQTYKIKVTQDYYETYQSTFIFDSDNNVMPITLVRKTEDEEEEEEDETGSSGGLSGDDEDDNSGSGDDSYSPGRTAARGTLEDAEENVPAMFSMLVMIVFVAAAKKGLK